MTQLATALLFSKSGLTRLIDRMVEAGLVQRLARPGDRRSLHIALTDAGEEKYREALPIHLDHVKRHFAAHIEDGEAAAVESALMRMANAVRRESGL
jgi:DNA-binding MarR family transcriptional regulator